MLVPATDRRGLGAAKETPELCLTVEMPSSPPSRRTTAPPGDPLPRTPLRLLAVMFAGGDVCQLGLAALEDVTGPRQAIQTVLRAWSRQVIAKEETGHGKRARRYRLLLTAGNGA